MTVEMATKNEILADDTFLVSYPRSGNTWARFVFANVMKKSEDEIIDFHSAIRYTPEVGVHSEWLSQAPRPRVIKSHDRFTEEYPKVIYLIRDPRDVYVSYFHYLEKRIPRGQTFSQFFRAVHGSASSWAVHVEEWMRHKNILVVRYEDLRDDPVSEFGKCIDFWGGCCGDTGLRRAIEASSFNVMRKLEQTRGRPFLSEEARQQATEFVRKGVCGGWGAYFSDMDLQFLYSTSRNLMQRFGYL